MTIFICWKYRMSNDWNDDPMIDMDHALSEIKAAKSEIRRIIIQNLKYQKEMMRLTHNESDLQEIQRRIDELEHLS